MADLKSILDELETFMKSDETEVVLTREQVAILRGAAAHHHQACEGRIVYRERSEVAAEPAEPEVRLPRRLDGKESRARRLSEARD